MKEVILCLFVTSITLKPKKSQIVRFKPLSTAMWISNFCVVNTRPDYISHGEAVRMQDEVKSVKNLDNLSCWCPDMLVWWHFLQSTFKQIQKFLAFGSTWCLSNHLTSKIRNSILKASSSQKISCSFDLTLLIHFTARLVYQLLLFFLFTSRLALLLTAYYHCCCWQRLK